IYEIVYTAKNPTVAGMGFAATRDLNAFLRNSAPKGSGGRGCKASAGHGDRGGGKCPPPAVNPGNPLGNAIKHTIIYGSSQSARWIRTFIHLGFNEDENGNQVFDGAIPHK